MTIHLPMPPSTNSLYANMPGVGRIPSKKFKRWKREAGWLLKLQKPIHISGPYELAIKIPRSMRGDASNRIKAVEDLLVEFQITSDDSKSQKTTIERADVTEMEIEVRAI
jgi:crossover junction endodeoxyribonuclease RusA